MDFIDCDVAMTSAWLNVNDSRQCMNAEHVHGDVFSGVLSYKKTRVCKPRTQPYGQASSC